MKRTRNGILIPDVPIMAGRNLPNAVKGFGASQADNPLAVPFFVRVHNSLHLLQASFLEISDDARNWQPVENMTLGQGTYYFRHPNSTFDFASVISTQTDETFDIGGNINSLRNHNFAEDDVCYNFYRTFHNSNVVSAAELILPAKTLTAECYSHMFEGCQLLTFGIELPAENLALKCYGWMYLNCPSLQRGAAILPAKTLAESCYQSMFQGCTNLNIAPILPATTLATNCYSGMLYQCNKVNRIECYAENLTATGALTNWVTGVAASGTFVKKAGVSWPSGNAGIPTNWVVEEIN